MELMRSLSRGFVAGCVGAVGFFVGAYAFIAAGLIAEPPVVELFQSKAFIYKQIVWGGLWGLLFALPLLRPRWWARGLVVGALATLVALFVFRSGVPPVGLVVNATLLNAVFWGMSGAFWHDRVLTGEQRAR